MARKLIYEVVLDSAAYSRQIKKVEAQTAAFAGSTKKLDRQLSQVTRGTLAGTGALHGLGRSLAFASGGFVAFEGVSRFLTDSINAAREAGVAQRSLAAQMKVSGESFAANRELIDKVALSYGKFGFNNDEVIQSLTILERGTGSVSKSLQMEMGVADVARGSNKSLAVASLAVAKAFGGQETALRRLVPGLPKAAHGATLVQDAFAKMAGQAAAGTTASEKFASTLHDTEEIIGTALLPTLNTYLAQLSTWLDKMNKSGKLQKDVAASAKVLSGTFDLVTTAIGKTVAAYSKLPDFGKRQGLLDIVRPVKGPSLLDILGITGDTEKKIDGATGAVGRLTEGLKKAGATGGKVDLRTAGGIVIPGRTAAELAKLEARKERRNTWFDQAIGSAETRAGLLPGLDAQIAAQQKILAKLKTRLANTNDITRHRNLYDRVLQKAAEIRGLYGQRAANRKQARDTAAQNFKDQIQAARQEKMGWLDFGIEQAEATKTMADNLPAYRKKEKFLLGLIKAEGRTLEHVSDLWRVRQKIKELNKKNIGDDPLAGLFQVSTKQLTNILSAGTGLSAAGRRQLGFNISGAEIQPVHVHLNLDGREVASVVTKQQARSSNRTTKQTSGRRG